MIWFFKTFWRSIAFFGALVGIYYIPADVLDPTGANAAWRGILKMLPPHWPLWTFAICATFYIIWLDARPWLYERFGFGPRTKWMKRAEEAEKKLKDIEEVRTAALIAASTPPPDVNEGLAKEAARAKVVVLAREYFEPTQMAMLHLYAFARDTFERRIGTGLAASGLGRGLDRQYSHADAPPLMSINEFQVASKVRRMSVQDAQSTYYTNYGRYCENVRLINDLIERSAPLNWGALQKIQALYEAWRAQHDRLVAEQIRLGREDIELGTIAGIPKAIPTPPDAPDWSKLKANP